MPAKVNIEQLGAELYAARKAGTEGAVVFLGAGASLSSGAPSWEALARRICEDYHLSAEAGKSVESLYRFFHGGGPASIKRFVSLSTPLKGLKHSRGYEHLAQLAQQGYISTILTTNWDSLIESALVRHIPVDRLRFLTRGLNDDRSIARALELSGRDDVVVIKLHGDLASRLFYLRPEEVEGFESELVKALNEKCSGLCYVVGYSGNDFGALSTILAAAKSGALYYTKYDTSVSGHVDEWLKRCGAGEVSGERKVVIRATNTVNIGDFDHFFTQLNLAVQLRKNRDSKDALKRLEREILQKEEVGLRYLSNSRIHSLLDTFWNQLKRYNPELVVFINDPAAPGGVEIKRRLSPRLDEANIMHEELVVEGAGASRSFQRRVRSEKWDGANSEPKKIFIVDSITFSGNTLALARKALLERYPHSVVQCGVLIVSQQLLRDVDENISRFGKIHYEQATDRFEIFFPWGVTQTTSDLLRRFPTLEGERTVQIVKRHWGAMELLAHDELCSTRLLVIDAGNKLSFQRHLCRDELYVALDDHIGLKIAGYLEEVEAVKQYDPQIQSLILEKGDYVLIPRGIWHRPEAAMDRARILEIAFGVYDQVYDIERIEDEYSRDRDDGKQ